MQFLTMVLTSSIFGCDKARSSNDFEEAVRVKAAKAARERARHEALQSFDQVSCRAEACMIEELTKTETCTSKISEEDS